MFGGRLAVSNMEEENAALVPSGGESSTASFPTDVKAPSVDVQPCSGEALSAKTDVQKGDQGRSGFQASQAVYFADVKERVASEDFKKLRKRRMSDPTGTIPLSSEELDALKSSGSPTPGDDSPDEDEAPRWEDWQQFAMSGAFTSPAAPDDEAKSLKLLASLSPYLPRVLVNNALYGLDTQLGKSPTVEIISGAVMIADITGFTPLTERALTSKRGTELVEELTVSMNNYFDEAVDLVLEYGGDIIKVHGSSFIASVDISPCQSDFYFFGVLVNDFVAYKLKYAGDSMIICFAADKASKETQASCALRATACGFDMISTLGAYTPELGGYGDTLVDSDGCKRDSKMPRSYSRPSSPSNPNEENEFTSVLVADDLMLNRVVLSKMLSKLNCEVVLAVTGKDAVIANSNHHFDVIFMDVHMPVLDGCGATRQIRHSRGSRTPVIGVCTKFDEGLQKQCLDAGMDQLLVKPVTMSQLVTILRSLKAAPSLATGADNPECAQANDVSKGIVSPQRRKSNSPPKNAGHSESAKKQPKSPRTRATSLRKSVIEGSSHVPDAPLTLTMKVLVGVGKVCMLSVGGELQLPSGQPRWEYFMADLPVAPEFKAQSRREPLNQLRYCEEHATSGNVILSPEVWGLVRSDCEGEILSGGFVRLSHVVTRATIPPPQKDSYDIRRVSTVNEILKRYLPEMLRSKLEAISLKDSGTRAEVRHVTCLFLGFPSLSNVLGSSVLLNNVQKAMVTVQRCLRLFDGLLVQFRMDEKGYVMVCAFGLPGNLHEDDPKRGVHTALNIKEKLTAFGQPTDIGVTTGKLLCTVVGGRRRREYTVFGNCINLSARLMKKANNEVLTDTDTYNMTSDIFEYMALPPMMVKGRKGLITVYQAVGIKRPDVLSEKSTTTQCNVSFISPSKRLEDLLCTAIYGRKTEMDLAMAKIDAFLSRHSRSYAQQFSEKEKESESKESSQMKEVEGSSSADKQNGDGPTLVTDISSVQSMGTRAEEVPCTAILVTGHAGIGKSKLIESIVCSMKDLPATILSTDSTANSNMFVFGPWVKMLLELLQFDQNYTPEERGAVVLKHLDPKLHEYAHLLKDILKVQFKEHDRKNVTQRKRSKDLKRSSSERKDMSFSRKGHQERRESFMAHLATKGALLFGSRLENEKSESLPAKVEKYSTCTDGISGLEVNTIQSSEKEDDLFEEPSTSEKTSTNPQLEDPSPEYEDSYKAHKRLSLDPAAHFRQESHDFEPNESVMTSTTRRRSSTELLGKIVSKVASPEISVQRVGKLLQNLLLAVAQKPCFIFIEDAHVMDNQSWAVLKGISEQEDSGIMLIVTCRPWGAHAPKEYNSVIQAASTLQLNLRELDEKATESLVRQKIYTALGTPVEIPPKVFEAISSRTQGHPLFAEHMAMALVELKIISASSQVGSSKKMRNLSLEKFNFSHSMEALITSRVDLLESNQGLTLKVASVIGVNFYADSLLPVLNQQLQREEAACLTKQQLALSLEGLDKLNFLNHRPSDPDGLYSFSNSLTREVTYEMLPIKQRRIIHADVAKELLKRGNSGVVRCVSIAHHYTMACKDVEEMEVDLTAMAIDHWEEAASSVLFKFGQYELAIQYYQNTISLGDTVRDHLNLHRIASWHHYLARAYAAVGEIDKSVQQTILALTSTGERSDELYIRRKTSIGCSSVFESGLSAWKTYCQIGIRNWLFFVTTKSEDSQEVILRCEALAHLATLAVCKEELQSARNISRRYLTVAKEVRKKYRLDVARAYSLRALVAESSFRARYSCHKCVEILRLLETSVPPAVQAGDIHHNLSVIYLFQGKWTKAEKHATTALKIYEASQGRREVDLCRCLIALGQLYRGEFESCHEAGVQMLEFRQDHPQLRFWATFLVVSSLNSMERYEESPKVISQLQDGPCSIPSLAIQVKALGWEASMRMEDGKDILEDVFTLLPQLLSLTPLTAIFPTALAAAAEVLLMSLEIHGLSDAERAPREELMKLSLKFFKTSARRIGICKFYYKFYKARLAWFRKYRWMSSSLFQEAHNLALKFKMKPAATAASNWLEKCKPSRSNTKDGGNQVEMHLEDQSEEDSASSGRPEDARWLSLSNLTRPGGAEETTSSNLTRHGGEDETSMQV